jgi:hypothetical protein
MIVRRQYHSNTSLLTFYVTVTLNPDAEVHCSTYCTRNHLLMHLCNFLVMLNVVEEIETLQKWSRVYVCVQFFSDSSFSALWLNMSFHWPRYRIPPRMYKPIDAS